MDARTSVVIATRDRRPQLLATLGQLTSMPERPHVIVVDNASSDGTAAAVSRLHPGVQVIGLPRNAGAVARNIGVAAAQSRYVAFADDDSWWEPGALSAAADLFDHHDEIGLIAAKVVVEPSGREDELSAQMARSPLPTRADWPGRAVLGFLACGSLVRRDAFVDVGGFDDLLFFLGEEELLAYDLAARGWGLVYVDDVIAHHQPGSATRDPTWRRTRQGRNHVLVGLMRRPARVAARRVASLCRSALSDAAARRAIVEVAQRLPVALRRRSQPVQRVEAQLRFLE
jgi:GT2 family glycosyltransferase